MKKDFDLMNIVSIILLIFSMAVILILYSGCAQKEVVITKYKYIEKPCPRLKVFESCDVNYTLTAYNKGERVCVKEWDACVKKDEMIKLIEYTHRIKSICKQYESEIKLYNQKIAKTQEPAN